jgi:branched-chain amino acid transport system ATP-binding protein
MTGATPGRQGRLEVSDIHAYYDSAEVLHGISLAAGPEPTAIVGRNGMGKTTLCNAIMSIQPPRVTGSIRFAGRELARKPSYRVSAAGIGYVPQGRRLFGSLSTEEHLRMVGAALPKRSRWTIDAVYELFPRLRDRRNVSGTQLSGGEQQMLAIARALLTNPRMMLMDEPSEGLAPTVVEGLIETCRTLVAEGVTLLIVEQNLGVATALTDRLLVMVSGEIARETTAAALLADEEAQRRFLGVEPMSAAPAAPDPGPGRRGP